MQNLLYDLSQIAIPWDSMDEEYVLVPHQWSVRSILRFMVWIGPFSSIFDILTFLLMYFVYDCKTQNDSTLFQTAWFIEGLATATLVVHMIRTPKIPFFQSRGTLPLIVSTFVVIALGIAIPFTPNLNTAISMEPLDAKFFGFLAAILLLYCTVAQLAKMAYIRMFGTWI